VRWRVMQTLLLASLSFPPFPSRSSYPTPPRLPSGILGRGSCEQTKATKKKSITRPLSRELEPHGHA